MLHIRWVKYAAACTALTFGGLVAPAQTAPISIDRPFAGDRNVTGQGAPASVPMTVYEVSGTTRNYLGKSDSVDQQGFYAVAISPVLRSGQKIVVVDAQGRASVVTTVEAKSGPAGPGPSN